MLRRLCGLVLLRGGLVCGGLGNRAVLRVSVRRSAFRRLTAPGRLGSFRARRHLQNDPVIVVVEAQIHRPELRILLSPRSDIRLVALEAFEKFLFAKMRQNVRSLLGHDHARIFRIGEIDF